MATSLKQGLLPRALAGLSVSELLEFSRFIKWSHQMGYDEGQLPPNVDRDPDVTLGYADQLQILCNFCYITSSCSHFLSLHC